MIGGLQGIDSLNDRMKERLKTHHDGMKRGKRQAELAEGGGAEVGMKRRKRQAELVVGGAEVGMKRG